MARSLSIVTGPAGAGKSTYGQKLAEEQGACLLDSDTVTEQVVRAGMLAAGLDPNDRDSPEYRHHFREPVYEALLQVAEENLKQVDVVIVGPFTSEIQDSEWPEVLEKRFQCEVEVIFVTCADDFRYQRIVERGNPRDRWKVENWEAYLAKSSTEKPAFEHLLVET